MVYPPTNNDYEFADKCVADDENHQSCDKYFQCGSCDLAWSAYKKELETDGLKDYLVPNIDWSKNGITTLRNDQYTIVKVDSIEDLYKRFMIDGMPFKLIEKDEMDTDDMKHLYPQWYALKVVENLGDPLSYKGGKDIPLIVEYSDCVYMVAPMRLWE